MVICDCIWKDYASAVKCQVCSLCVWLSVLCYFVCVRVHVLHVCTHMGAWVYDIKLIIHVCICSSVRVCFNVRVFVCVRVRVLPVEFSFHGTDINDELQRIWISLHQRLQSTTAKTGALQGNEREVKLKRSRRGDEEERERISLLSDMKFMPYALREGMLTRKEHLS